MACCYSEDCGEFAVTPMLIAPCLPTKCCEDPPVCYPCLPRCPKGQVVYCCEKPPSRCEPCCEHSAAESDGGDCNHSPPPKQQRSRPPAPRQSSCAAPPNCCPTCCRPMKTKYVIPCYRYEDGRIVKKLPVSAFKRNGMQDQEHSKLLGTTNYLVRHPRDVSIECEICTNPVKMADPAKVPPCKDRSVLGCSLLKKKPIQVSLEDILDD